MNAQTFWDNVKPMIKAHGLTQAKLAESCQIPFGTLQGWIAKSVIPDAVSAVKIAKLLNTSVEYLVTGEESNQYKVQLDQLKETLRQLANS